MNVVPIDSEADFERIVLQAEQPVLVEFWGTFCCQCDSFEPLLLRMADEFAGVVQVVKVNAFALDELAKRYQVVGIPTTIFFWCGSEIYRLWGPAEESMFRRVLGRFLARVREEAPV